MLHGETGVFQKTTPCLLYTRGTASGGSLSLLTGALEAQWAVAKSRTRAVQPQARSEPGSLPRFPLGRHCLLAPASRFPWRRVDLSRLPNAHASKDH